MKSIATGLLFGAAILGLSAGHPAYGASQTVLGRRFQVKDPGDPIRRRVSAVGQERNSPNTVVGDPTQAGGSLQIIVNGATNSSQTFSLAAAGWRPMSTGFRYSGARLGGPVRNVTIKKLTNGSFQIRAMVNGRNGALNVKPGNPSDNGGIVLFLGGGDTYCVSFGAAAGGTVQINDAHTYQVRNASAEACPPGGGTTTTTTTTTTSTTVATCPPPPPTPMGSLTTTIQPGSSDCGGVGLVPSPASPFTGEVDNPDTTLRSNLGAGCLYVGSGQANLPGSALPDGGQTILDVAGVNGAAITVTASNGTGPADCSKGAGPNKICLNGLGPCTTDADCGGTKGACDLEAHCYFGPPIPVPLGPASNCIMNAIASDVCAEADLASNNTTITSALLSARVYLTGDGASPCPVCQSGTCQGGENDGGGCTGNGIGSKHTTIECPPDLTKYAGTLNVNLSGLTTADSTMTADVNGKFCPGQKTEGAFGGPAGTIIEHGVPLGGGMSLFDTTLAGTFCVPSSGNLLFDSTAGLPGPGAVGVPASVSICLTNPVCNQLCNPCNLGPLCAVVCAPCNLCL